jgi:hypothetical protein
MDGGELLSDREERSHLGDLESLIDRQVIEIRDRA